MENYITLSKKAKIITLTFYLLSFSLLFNACGKNTQKDFFSDTDNSKNIAVLLIPDGECVNCKTLLYKNIHKHLKEQYPEKNIFYLFKSLRKKEAEHFLKFNFKNYNPNQIIIDKELYENYWSKLNSKQASVLVIDHNKKILLQRPVKMKIINNYDFLIK